MNTRIPLNMDEPAHAPPQPQQPWTPPAADAKLSGDALKEVVIAALKTCFDPEVPVNIYELGLIYDIAVSPDNQVAIKMTLTSPACPVAGSLPPEVQAKVSAIPGIAGVQVELVWDPPWTQDRMTEAAQLQLGLF